MPFRRVLSKADQAAFDRMFACATPQIEAEIQLGRPWKFEALLMALLLAYEKLIAQVRMRLEAVNAEMHRREPKGNPPD